MNDNTNLEENALKLLANIFYNSGYRKGVAHGFAATCAGVIVGMAATTIIWLKEEGYFKKTENEE